MNLCIWFTLNFSWLLGCLGVMSIADLQSASFTTELGSPFHSAGGSHKRKSMDGGQYLTHSI